MCCWLSHITPNPWDKRPQIHSPVFTAYQTFPVWSQLYMCYTAAKASRFCNSAEGDDPDHQPSGPPWHVFLRLHPVVYSFPLKQFDGKSIELHPLIIDVACCALAFSSRRNGIILLLPEPGLSWHGSIFFREKKRVGGEGWGERKKKNNKNNNKTGTGKNPANHIFGKSSSYCSG